MKKIIFLTTLLLAIGSCSKKIATSSVSRGGLDMELVNNVHFVTSELMTQKGTDKSVAGLVAMLDIIREEQLVIGGAELIQVIDQLNPDLQRKEKLIYALSNIDQIQPVGNQLTFQLVGGDPIKLDKIRVDDQASMQVTNKGDTTILQINNGISVGLGFIRFDLSEILIFQKNGDLLVSYGSSSQKRINMRRDILD